MTVVLHRLIGERINTCTIRRSPIWKWDVSFFVECDPDPTLQKNDLQTEEAVGIDVGIESFATLSNSEKIENPRFFRTDEKALSKTQRKLSKTENGTPEWKKFRKVVARIHERIGKRRLDFAHKTSRRLVDRYGTITLKDLTTTSLQKNHRLAKSLY